MASDESDQAVELLTIKEKRLEAELGEIEKKHEDLQISWTEKRKALVKCRKDIAGLREKPYNPDSDGKDGRFKLDGAKSGCSAAEVAEMIVEFLKTNGTKTEEEIKQRVSQRAKELGKSRAGIHKSVNKALHDDRFEKGIQGWNLKPL
jgi:hypothetical protein